MSARIAGLALKAARFHHRLAWLTGDQRGVSIAETAFVLPVLLVMMLGLFEVGRVLFTKGVLTHSVQEGARLALVSPAASEDAIKARITQNFTLIDPARLAVFDIDETVNADSTRTIVITVVYNYDLAVPFLSDWAVTLREQETVFTG
ncbi:MAG: TadE/TadG family type IV pilus assembly protein [Pseudomonadota bacterium]